jgi:hypothetical protein
MQGLCYGFAALLFAASCANDDTVQEGKQKENNIPAGATVFTGTSQPGTTTRTAILNHTKGSGASVNWSSSDKIWVKDDAGTWQQSGAAVFPSTTNLSLARFALLGTYTGASHDILYTNKAVAGSQAQVEIKAEQTQSAPNNFDHAGESGDCGVTTGNKAGNSYNFTLDHKAAYLCFIPRSSNPYVNRSKLIKVEIMSDDDIAGTYDIAADGTLTLASGGSKTITVTTGSGFTIDNSTEDMSKNATYAVVAPGTHTFRVRYWLRNTTDNPKGTIEGTVSKIVTLNCTAGSIHDITANLNPHNYDGDHYYMWDAKKQYWEGYEWNKGGSQPTLESQPASSNYAQINTDSRYYNDSYPGPGISNPATQDLFKSLPNANEMAWYGMYGDPRWDGDELWTTMGHLYKGGMWFKKKSVLQAENHYDTEVSPLYGLDMRKSTIEYSSDYSASAIILSGIPSVAAADNYFYLPALGYYFEGKFGYIGAGNYWSSTARSTNGGSTNSDPLAYYINFGPGFLNVVTGYRYKGLRVQAFE